MESKHFGNALQTFNKIKKFNLDSMEADNVDYDTPKNKAIELSNFDGNAVLKSYYKYDKYVFTILILAQRLAKFRYCEKATNFEKKIFHLVFEII